MSPNTSVAKCGKNKKVPQGHTVTIQWVMSLLCNEFVVTQQTYKFEVSWQVKTDPVGHALPEGLSETEKTENQTVMEYLIIL